MLYSLWDLFGVISRSRHDIQSQGPVGGSVFEFFYFYFWIFIFDFPRRHRCLAARDISLLDAMSAHTRVLNKPLWSGSRRWLALTFPQMTKLWLLLPNCPLGNQVIWLGLLHQWWVARRNRNCLGSQWGFPLPPGNAKKPLISGSSSVQILTMHSITHVIIPCNHTPQQGPFSGARQVLRNSDHLGIRHTSGL